jgi:sortase A
VAVIDTPPGRVPQEPAGPGVSSPDAAWPGSAAGDEASTRVHAPKPLAPRVEAVTTRVVVAFALLMGGFLLFVFVLSGLSESRAQAGLQRRFEKLLVDGRAPVAARIRYGTPVARLDIPSVGIHQIVVEGTTPGSCSGAPAMWR